MYSLRRFQQVFVMNVSHASDDNAAATMNAASQRETIRAAFRAFDEDGSGRIDANELSDLITSLGGVMSSVELQEALRVLDKDGDGVVDQDEFEKWWTSASDDLDGDGRLGQLETALARLKEHGQKRFHVDIHTACWHGHLDVVTRLVEADREIVHAKDTTEFGDLNTPLHYAAYQGHLDLCQFLLHDARAKVDATNAMGCTPLFYASQQDRHHVVKFLLQGGANARLRESEHHFSAVDVACSLDMLVVFRSHTPNDKPSVPLAPVVAATVPSTSRVQISWRPPASKPSESLPISGYKIKVTLLLSNEPLTTTLQLVGPHPTTLWLDKLVQDASYTVQVAAVTLHGASDYSIGTVISTLPDILVGD
ncbi:hypothetical protein H257_14589 [Aphanomyces astaci]|uniref:Uncharacterized protein n=1 Tax=Aphanomyces astaci TaxID=112090 RepID=W4FS07_APHAT|nr:hypothetical protein H257_14589 [Aphanomyces astaci]ETV69741.1 hypothetical protein H257_14589 [Aphanomyces astaci]|eukprot:XP_009840755.1 hypothetical protein H257_14589 [Aphanomyces astaci]